MRSIDQRDVHGRNEGSHIAIYGLVATSSVLLKMPVTPGWFGVQAEFDF